MQQPWTIYKKTNCYYAYLLPTLLTIQREIDNYIEKDELTFHRPAAIAIKNGIKSRFNDVMDIDNPNGVLAYIAAVTHPFFKTRWMKCTKSSELISKIKTILLENYKKEVPITINEELPTSLFKNGNN